MDERSRIPKVKALPAPEELRKLPLTPMDGFVLSRVDGTSTEDEIVGVTGLPTEQVRACLERLAALSLISLGDGPAARARPISGVTAREPLIISSPPASERAISRAAPAAPAPSQAKEAGPGKSGGVDLSEVEQRRIDDLFVQIDELDHYAVLGVARTAEKKEIKRAYFERAATFHPDRYFRRNVGDFKPKLEAIFGRITTAHDVLTDKARRAEYDQYLGHVALSRELEDRVKQGAETVREAEVAARAAPIVTPTASPAGTAVVAPPPPVPPVPPAAPLPFAAQPGEVRRPSRPIVPIAPQARRDLLAKHLRGGRSLTPSKIPAAVTTPPADPDILRRHYDQKKQDVARAQATRHKLTGDHATAEGDFITAASSYKAALSFVPDDPELKRLFDDASRVSESTLVETYRNQAAYEERNNRWADAAKSWAKLARLLPDAPDPHERAAHATLLAKGNLHDAAAFAQRAVTLAPQSGEYRRLLATIYLEAGLLKNARRELDVAEQLLPDDPEVAALARRLTSATGR